MPRRPWRDRLARMLRGIADRIAPRGPAERAEPPEFWLARARAGRPVGMPGPGPAAHVRALIQEPDGPRPARPRQRVVAEPPRWFRGARIAGLRTARVRRPRVGDRSAVPEPPSDADHSPGRPVIAPAPEKVTPAHPAPVHATRAVRQPPPLGTHTVPSAHRTPVAPRSGNAPPEPGQPALRVRAARSQTGPAATPPSAPATANVPRPAPTIGPAPRAPAPGPIGVPMRPAPTTPAGGRRLVLPARPDEVRPARLAARDPDRADAPPLAPPLPSDGLWPELPHRPPPAAPDAEVLAAVSWARRQRLSAEQAAT